MIPSAQPTVAPNSSPAWPSGRKTATLPCRRNVAGLSPWPSPACRISTSSSSAPDFPASTPPIICRPIARKVLRHLGSPRRHRRHLGLVSLSRHSVRFRHVHVRLFFSALAGEAPLPTAPPSAPTFARPRRPTESIARSASDIVLNGRRGRRDARNGRIEARARPGGSRFPSPATSSSCAPATMTMTTATRRLFRAQSNVRRPHRPSAALAGRYRLCRQTRRRDRQRRNSGHARARHRRARRARHHAAALADLCGLCARRRTRLRTGCGAVCRHARLMGSRAGTTCCSGIFFFSLYAPRAQAVKNWIVKQAR